MVINSKKHIDKSSGKQGPEEVRSEPNKIGASTPLDLVTLCCISLSL